MMTRIDSVWVVQFRSSTSDKWRVSYHAKVYTGTHACPSRATAVRYMAYLKRRGDFKDDCIRLVRYGVAN